MEFDQMLQLIDRVSGSNLDSFVYEQNGMKLKLEKKKQKIQVSRETGSVEMIEAEAAERPEAAGGENRVSSGGRLLYRPGRGRGTLCKAGRPGKEGPGGRYRRGHEADE